LTFAGYFSGGVKITNNLEVLGSKSAAVKCGNGEYRLLYAQESPENWFEDFGTAQLVNGQATVKIDPLYAQTVNTAVTYHVFLTPEGDCRGLYVTNETPTSFEIRELQNGKSDLSVSYRIVAKRKGYENVRLAKMEGPTPEEVQAKDVKLQAEMVKENARHQEEQAKMEAERKLHEEQRAKMEQERLMQEKKIKENK
jgi:RNA polymerase-interacting CarD/CdnL/TRCF family regulator